MLSLRQAIDRPNSKFPRAAISAFTINDMTDMQGVMRAAMQTHRPCIMMARILSPAREAVQKAVEGKLAVPCTPRTEEMI